MEAEDGLLSELISLAVPLCQQAEKQYPRQGPGRKPEIPDWFLAVMIMVAIAKRKKSKSAQLQFWVEHKYLLEAYCNGWNFPARSTFYDRYRRAWQLFEKVIFLHSKKAVRYGWATADIVSVDKSIVPAKGKRPRRKRKKPQRFVDYEATWSYSSYHKWIYGYSYELVVTSSQSTVSWPLLALVDTGSRSEMRTLGEKIPHLPDQVKYVLADRGYDADDHCESLEWEGDQRTGRRFVCPPRRSPRGPAKKEHKRSKRRKRRQSHRQERREFVNSPEGRNLYDRRGVTIEPFNAWFKLLFDLNDRVWHRGVDNNRTQILAAVFAYQLLLRINWRRKNKNGKIKWILDAL